MPNIVWATDIHLNFVDREPVSQNMGRFIRETSKLNPDVLIITGDISEADHISDHLEFLACNLQCKICFVLGNHDYYNGSFQAVRNRVKICCANHSNLCYLSDAKFPYKLDDNVYLIGHDGWYDGLYANWFAKGVVVMNDYVAISDFKNLYLTQNMIGLHLALQDKAREGAEFIKSQVSSFAKDGDTFFIATHIPPWPENSVYNGKISDSAWLPNFSSKIMGDAILELADKYPNVNFKVLCGHSHGDATYAPRANISSTTGFSSYNRPWLSLKNIAL